jgi:catechol 2,3-dioxygenase-like lactoylglutathione lyase family enzyme
MELGRFRIGLRVRDVDAAAAFYRGLGFNDVATVPDQTGAPVMVVLEREGAMLIVDALHGMPFEKTAREGQVQEGPRGLGVAIGLGVVDLDSVYRWCRDSGCEITSEPRLEPYGDRVFEFVDADGYLWEVSEPVADVGVDAGVQAVREAWFGREDG